MGSVIFGRGDALRKILLHRCRLSLRNLVLQWEYSLYLQLLTLFCL